MSTEKLISRHPLANELTLEFWDLSRLMAGDRWLVILEARLAIPVGAATLPPDLAAREAEVVKTLGPVLLFSQRDQRIFIDVKDLQDTLKEMETRLLTLAPTYFGHSQFSARLIRKRFAENQDKQRWQSRQTQQ